MNKGYLALWILGFILLILDLGIVVSLLKKGDEKRQMIIWKSSTYTFGVVVGVLMIESISKLISAACNFTSSVFNDNSTPFSLLTIISIIYFLSLKYNQKKFGD